MTRSCGLSPARERSATTNARWPWGMLREVDLKGRRPVDVAAEQGITPNAAMVKLHRARRALRMRLEESCRTCATHGCLDCTCKGLPALPSA